MNKEFIPYEQALELKRLGFDEKCLPFYNNTITIIEHLLFPEYSNDLENYNSTTHLISAPIYQQAFRWFREKYGLIGHVRESWSFNNIMEYVSQINGTFVNHSFIDKPINRFNTYEEAELACLKKLIEIVKGGNK